MFFCIPLCMYLVNGERLDMWAYSSLYAKRVHSVCDLNLLRNASTNFSKKSNYVIQGVSKVAIYFEKQRELRKTGLRYEKLRKCADLLQSKSAHLRNFSYLKRVFLNSHCFWKWIVTFETPYKLRKCDNLLRNKHSFRTLNPFFLIFITFQNSEFRDTL
jgi:hypothetical protein